MNSKVGMYIACPEDWKFSDEKQNVRFFTMFYLFLPEIYVLRKYYETHATLNGKCPKHTVRGKRYKEMLTLG